MAEKRYDSDAERQKAYRERKKAQGPPADPESTGPDFTTLKVPLETYVQTIRLESANYADSIGETDAPFTVSPEVVLANRKSDRMDRAERYARWRYQAVLDGEISTL